MFFAHMLVSWRPTDGFSPSLSAHEKNDEEEKEKGGDDKEHEEDEKGG